MITPKAKRYTVKNLSQIKAFRFGALKIRFLSGDKPFGKTSILHEQLGPSCRVPDLYHKKTDELVILLKGRLTARLNGKPFALRAGDVLFLPAGTRHQFVTGSKAAEALSIFTPCMTLKNMDVISVGDKAPGKRAALK
ncbi:MAG: cupin domain-containing protein [Elusimicrobia bacterium]|nr:cupin domain-containing protein [Elusimicrobiota bacterium]